MNAKVLIFTPFYGPGAQRFYASPFMNRLNEVCANNLNYKWIALVNDGQQSLSELSDQAKKEGNAAIFSECMFRAVEGTGVASVMRSAYKRIDLTDQDYVVKIDDAEHPSDHIQTMLQQIYVNGHSAVLANLTYSRGNMLGVHEWQSETLTQRWGAECGLPFRIGHAHGFQIFKAQDLKAIAYVAGKIFDEAEWILRTEGVLKQNEDLTWGFDFAMQLGALRIVGPRLMSVCDVEGKVQRDRGEAKNLKQRHAWRAMRDAYQTLYA